MLTALPFGKDSLGVSTLRVKASRSFHPSFLALFRWTKMLGLVSGGGSDALSRGRSVGGESYSPPRIRFNAYRWGHKKFFEQAPSTDKKCRKKKKAGPPYGGPAIESLPEGDYFFRALALGFALALGLAAALAFALGAGFAAVLSWRATWAAVRRAMGIW